MIKHSEIVVYGATPCGLSAAIASARYGRRVTLLAHGKHIGGMMASGLSITDLRFPWAFGGIFKQFTDRVNRYYADKYGADSEEARKCNDGIWFEPHVAELLFEEMVAEQPNITLIRDVRLVEARKEGSRVTEIAYKDRSTGTKVRHTAAVWIDGSYEGDLAALAGVSYRVGREGREEYGEPYAGFIFLKNPGLQVLEGSTGEGDGRIQAYNYRLCLTNRDDLRVPPERPADYDRSVYEPLVALASAGRIKGMNDIVRLAPIPNGKYNANNRPIPVSLDLPERNTSYPEADEAERQRIVDEYRGYMMGLLWFAQHDEKLPLEVRSECRTWGFPKDEFTDNGHVPYEFYVREARRIVGRATFTSHDAFLAPGSERTPIHADSIAVGDYHVDSHIVQRKKEGWPQMEGHVYLRALSKPAQIPYGVMLPRDIEGLLVPGAMSATHLGFSVLRMEPPWSALGQAAGTAAHLALQSGTLPSAVDVTELQRMLLEDGQVITFFYDVPGPDPIWEMLNVPGERTKQDTTIETAPSLGEQTGLQFFGTKGFFHSYYARPYDALTRSEAVRWLSRFADIAEWRKKLDRAAASDTCSGRLRENAEAEFGGMKEGPSGVAADLVGAQEEQNAAAGRSAEAISYSDVPADHPDYPYIAGLRTIVDGWLGTNGFYPGAALSRADAVRWLARLLRRSGAQLRDPADAGAGWRDVGEAHPDYAHFRLLEQGRVIPASWSKNGEIEPLSYVTREQFCQMLYTAYFGAMKKPVIGQSVEPRTAAALQSDPA